MTKFIGAREARIQFTDLMDTVHYGGQTVIIEKFGRPLVAVIPFEIYQHLIADRQVRYELPDGVLIRLPEIQFEELDQDS
jgi:prevent-host-death family protein